MTLLDLLIVAFVGACLAGPLSLRLGAHAGWVLAALPAFLFYQFWRLAPLLKGGLVVEHAVEWVPSLGIDLALRLDGFSFLFVLLITGIGALVVVYAGAYMAENSLAARARFFTLILLFMTSMLGAVLANNLMVLFMFWEATSILSFLLIGFESRSALARRSAVQALQVTAGGGLALLAAFVLIGVQLGTFSVTEVLERRAELVDSPWIWLIVTGLLVGAFTKSAQFPFHLWLPNAMQAPTPASAYLHSATMVKLGIYLLARFEPMLGEVPGVRAILLATGSITMLIAALYALRAEGFKAALAYSTMASLGILVMLIGLDGPTTAVAIVGFILAHALYKAALFFCAGSVIHSTGISRLRRMGGLARLLPVTAGAAILASLSMAGLPPFIGFISKELLFEAQIESTWVVIPVAIAVVVNAVMVGVAGVVSLRPFFTGNAPDEGLKHRETTGIVIGPAVLAVTGLLISVDSGWIAGNVLRPASYIINDGPLKVDIALWHGLTPMLALSVAVLAIGGAIVWFWRAIHLRLRSVRLLDEISGDRAYDAGMWAITRSARLTSRLVQHGDLRRYLFTVLAATTLLLGWAMLAGGILPRWPAGSPVQAGSLAVLVIGVAGALAAARAHSLLSGMLAVGLAGLAVALTFLMNGGPDLALTQFAVEALIVVLLTATLLALPLQEQPSRLPRERVADAILSGCVGLLVLVATLDMLATTPDASVAGYYGQESYRSAFGRNVVNVILVDFRALDTLGETIVVGMAAIMVAGVLRGADPAGHASERPTALILRLTLRPFFALLLATSLFILLRGHNEPGGGFIGGLVAALAFALIALADGPAAARAMLRIHPLVLVGVGALAAIGSGVPGLFLPGGYLTHLWAEPQIAGIGIKLGTTLVFDIGVYAVVLGSVLAFLSGVQREGSR
ncbi:hydrogen gas-evolving membrane-bound hydrogenase subunit E [Geminicoccus roseus]|uniref:hydrogen gas-evolving membrane-bound hydrogenase subunit E n=1 Tax=Geminicoccus roseus TaxID=404900 RepID=UPI000419D14F|nr:hydrogen gas-evolving membrane-bound hydrogenase subunit E [Geminicoccus roseus]